MEKYIWLSYPLGLSDPRPPAIPAPELLPFMSIKKDGAYGQIIKVANHIGTHVDAARHVIETGVYITDYSPWEFIFTKPVVIDLSLIDQQVVMPKDLEVHTSKLQKADIALFRFGYGKIRKSEPERFSLRSPGFGVESARWLKINFPKLRAIGMDVPSLACIAHLDQTMSSHNELLGGDGCRFLVIEDMNLNHDLASLREIRLSPWLVTGMDSGPCSVVGVLK